ncbi:aspartate-glutamate racemase family [Tasmannia lanceolata]|uniref:aspartate-glutamate racemase family n=1 Tax=Tasmannia lanceolata TaxID=3420 RepID=UPI004063C4DD
MTMFHTLNCPSHIVGGLNKHRTHFKTRSSNPVFVVKSSSILLQTDENDNLPESKNFSSGSSPTAGLIFSQDNAVGIIGGVSTVSTLSFLKKLVMCSTKDGEEGLPFIVCSDPGLSKKLLAHEGGSFSNPNSKDAYFHLDQTPIVENLRNKRAYLEQSGARCIVMPCHISHSWHGEISEGCSVPFLHVGECVAKELKEAKLKPVEAGNSVRIGVLASYATLTAGFYQEKLQNQGFEVILPDKATMEHTVIPAIEAFNRKDMEGARNLVRIALQVLLVRAVNTVILASDEMHNLLPQDDPLLKKCIDPLDALVRSTIQWAHASEKVKRKY